MNTLLDVITARALISRAQRQSQRQNQHKPSALRSGIKLVLLTLMAALLSVSARADVTFYLIADPQFENGNNKNNDTRKVMAHVGIEARRQLTSVFVLGDLTQNGRQDEFKWYAKSRSSSVSTDENDNNQNFFIELPGNHDYDDSGWTHRAAWNGCVNSLRSGFNCAGYSTKSPVMYRYYFSSYKHRDSKFDFRTNPSFFDEDTPEFFLFNKRGIIFASLGNTPHFGENTGQCQHGGVSTCNNAILNALINAFKRGGFDRQAPIVLMLHQGFSHNGSADNLSADYQRLLQFIREHNVIALFSGHNHSYQKTNLTNQYGVRNMFGRTVNQYRLASARDQKVYYKANINLQDSRISLDEYQPLTSTTETSRDSVEELPINADQLCQRYHFFGFSGEYCSGFDGNSLKNLFFTEQLTVSHPLIRGMQLYTGLNGSGDSCRVEGAHFNGDCDGANWRYRIRSVQFLFHSQLPETTFCSYPNSSYYNIPKCRTINNSQRLASLKQLYGVGSFKINHPVVSSATLHREPQRQGSQCAVNRSSQHSTNTISFDGFCQSRDWRWRSQSLSLNFDDSLIPPDYYCAYPNSDFAGEPQCYRTEPGFFRTSVLNPAPGSLRFSPDLRYGVYLSNAFNGNQRAQSQHDRCRTSGPEFNGQCNFVDWSNRVRSLALLQPGVSLYYQQVRSKLCVVPGGFINNNTAQRMIVSYCNNVAGNQIYRQWRYDPTTMRMHRASDPTQCMQYQYNDGGFAYPLISTQCSDSEKQKFLFDNGIVKTRRTPHFYLSHTASFTARMYNSQSSYSAARWRVYRH